MNIKYYLWNIPFRSYVEVIDPIKAVEGIKNTQGEDLFTHMRELHEYIRKIIS